MLNSLYTGWATRKTCHFTFVHIFANYWPIFKILTGTLCRQFAIMWLLRIPAHGKCVSTLPCEISMKYACIIIITNKHIGKIEKKHFRPTLEWGLYDTKLCGSNTVYVIQIIYRVVGLKYFFHLPKFLLLSLVFAYVYISQGSVETHLPCGGIYMVFPFLFFRNSLKWWAIYMKCLPFVAEEIPVKLF